MSSKVYFTDMHTSTNENLPEKLRRLIIKAGIKNIDFKDKFTCIKLHFGEPGNLAYLRPNYAKVIADLVRELGGKPYLSDANTLYVGGRKNAIDHMESAYENGFSPLTTGCHVIIADGLKGTNETLVPVANGEYVKEAKIGSAFMDADVFISLSHAKGHGEAGFGGCLKNIGMGCGSRAGKMEMHSSSKPTINADGCVNCGACAKICAHSAIDQSSGKAQINQDKCVGCGRCIGVCPKDAVSAGWDEANDVLNRKVAEYTKAVVDGRPCFHIALAIDISPNCDCWSSNDVAIVPNIGMFASFDPVALDMVCVDAINAQTPAVGSVLHKKCQHDHSSNDHFQTIHPDSNWRAGLEHGAKIGLGCTEYELIKI